MRYEQALASLRATFRDGWFTVRDAVSRLYVPPGGFPALYRELSIRYGERLPRHPVSPGEILRQRAKSDLLRLHRMGLISRCLVHSDRPGRSPYVYRVSRKGVRYLAWLEQGRPAGHPKGRGTARGDGHQPDRLQREPRPTAATISPTAGPVLRGTGSSGDAGIPPTQKENETAATQLRVLYEACRKCRKESERVRQALLRRFASLAPEEQRKAILEWKRKGLLWGNDVEGLRNSILKGEIPS